MLDSGNLVYKLDSELKKKGYKFEVVSTPCHLARGGCSLCLKFPEEFLGVVKAEASKCEVQLRGVYKIVPNITRNKYKRI
jgi:hypothetical protein